MNEKDEFETWFDDWRRSTWHPLTSDPRTEMPEHWNINAMRHMSIAWKAARYTPTRLKAERALREERAKWFSLVMGACAALEDAANHLRDGDAKRIAMSSAEHYRRACKS